MFRILTILVLALAASATWAEEVVLKDGTKIVGKMTAINGDKIEVETAYGKMQINRADIVTITFSANSSPSSSGKPALPDVDDSLHGNQYVNKTGSFSLVLPNEWSINPSLRMSADVLAGLSSKDNTRYAIVIDEPYPGSADSYKGLVLAQARANLQDYEKLMETPTTINGKPSLLLSYRGVSPAAKNLPIQFLVAVIPSGKGFYRVTTWCIEPLFNESQATFETILRSFHDSAPTQAQTAVKKP